jgi:acyl carrier protein
MSPTHDDIAEEIRQAVAKIILADAASVNDVALSNLDSIGRITLLVELENKFSVELTAEEYAPEIFSSIDQLTDFVWKVSQKTH